MSSVNKSGKAGGRAHTLRYDSKGSRQVEPEYQRYTPCGATQFLLHPDLEAQLELQRSRSDTINPLVPRMYGDRVMWSDKEFQRLAKALADTDFFQNAGWDQVLSYTGIRK